MFVKEVDAETVSGSLNRWQMETKSNILDK